MYQNVHTHYLIVGMKIPTHKDIPVPPQNTIGLCLFEKNFKLTEWRSQAYKQCHFFNGLFNQTLLEGSHLYTKIFQVLHSDIPALLQNQKINFLSEIEHPLREVEQIDKVLNKTCSKGSTVTFLLWQKYIDLNHIGLNMVNNFPVIFDTLYVTDKCDSCNQRKRENIDS